MPRFIIILVVDFSVYNYNHHKIFFWVSQFYLCYNMCACYCTCVDRETMGGKEWSGEWVPII